MNFPSLNEQMDVIRSGAVDVLPEEELAQKIEQSIKTGKALNVKLGCDPSRPDLHIGHAVVLNKLRQFQDLGHQAILIVGDFTAMIGDPSGRSKTRPALTMQETRENGQSYFDQATRVLASRRITMVYNSDWLGRMTFEEVITLAAKSTVAQILERDDFTKRYSSGQPISLHEFMYPLAQAMDSVVVEADVELGGTDQKFNLLLARETQKAYNVPAQCIVTMPILEGTDGVEKMSKSLDNYIALKDIPREMFGKTMSIPDTLITRYFRMAAFAPNAEVAAMEAALANGALHPREAKVRTAKAIIERYYSANAAEEAYAEFEKMFRDNLPPDEIDEFVIEGAGADYLVIDAIAAAKMAASKSEARRLIQQGGVSIDGKKVEDLFQQVDLSSERLFKVGKRKFLRIRGTA